MKYVRELIACRNRACRSTFMVVRWMPCRVHGYCSDACYAPYKPKPRPAKAITEQTALL